MRRAGLSGGTSDEATRVGAVAGGVEEPAGPEPVGGLELPGDIGVVEEASDGAGSVAELPGPPDVVSAVVRTATLSVQVGDDGFQAAFDTASLVAGKYGGFVESSSTAGTKVRRGDLLIRVPADRFDEAMRDLRALGTVERQELAGRDVSAEFVDLEARLRTWEAQEAVLLDLMADATSIEATLRVQRELQDVQLRIEEIEGQLRFLRNRTDLATIQVSLHEPGVAITTKPGPTTRPSLAEAWEKAIDGFLAICYAIVVGLGYLLPLSALALLLWLGVRRFFQPRASTPAA
jgi:hypothetical protein